MSFKTETSCISDSTSSQDPRLAPLGCVSECRACPHRYHEYNEGLRLKVEHVKSLAKQFNISIEPPRLHVFSAPTDSRWGYRRRALLRIAPTADRSDYNVGFIRSRKPLEVLDISTCPLHEPKVQKSLLKFKAYLSRSAAACSNIPLHSVLVQPRLVTLVIKASPSEGQDLLKSHFAWFLDLEEELQPIQVRYCLNPSAGNRIFYRKGFYVINSDSVFESVASTLVFDQVLAELHSIALKESASYLEPSPQQPILDFYSGTGASLEVWSRSHAPCLGVELVSEAVEIARVRANPNSVLQGSVETRVAQIESQAHAWTQSSLKFPRIYLNPPSTGLDHRLVESLADGVLASADRMAYLSCQPRSLFRDLAKLTSSGWRIHSFNIFDFFPQTGAIEVLVHLEK